MPNFQQKISNLKSQKQKYYTVISLVFNLPEIKLNIFQIIITIYDFLIFEYFINIYKNNLNKSRKP